MILAFAFLALVGHAQTNGGSGAGLPQTCVAGSLFVNTADTSLNLCGPTNTWAPVGGGAGIPAGSVVLIVSGGCPTGYAEETALDGKAIIGTLAANGNIGTTGGADTITPTGVNSGGAVSAHAGAAVADHAAHTHTFTQSANAATPDLVTLNTASTGVAASGTTGNPNATLTHAVTQPSAHVVTQPTFTGVQFDNRSAFARVIFCRKT